MTNPLHIAVVVHSLNHNNVGRVYPFLQAFVGAPDVCMTVVGWDHTGTLSPLLRDVPWPIVKLHGAFTGRATAAHLRAALRGCHVIHCFKNQEHFRTLLGVAQQERLPLVLDLDDWELGLYLEGVARWPRWRRALWGWPITRRIEQALELDRLARTAPAALLVNSMALQAHFGGSVVYTAADAAQFDPQRADGPTFRVQHGIAPNAPVIGFPGTPHPHKGIDILLRAFADVRRTCPAARLLVVGVPAHNPYYAALLATPGVVVVGYLPANSYPHAYAACDVVAIPQQSVIESIMQTPAKLILAMAATRPIVTTMVGDIPAILGGAGVYVQPDDAVALGTVLIRLLGAPRTRAALGAAAHARFSQRLTLEHVRERMLMIYKEVVENA